MENARLRTFYSGEALEAKRRVKLTGSFVDDTPEVVYADAGEEYVAITRYAVADNTGVACTLRNVQGTVEAEVDGAVGANKYLYGAVDGKFSGTEFGEIQGRTLEAATTSGDYPEIMQIQGVIDADQPGVAPEDRQEYFESFQTAPKLNADRDQPAVTAAALTDSSTGTPGTLLSAVTNTNALTDNTGGGVGVIISAIAITLTAIDITIANANFASLANELSIQKTANTSLTNSVASLAAQIEALRVDDAAQLTKYTATNIANEAYEITGTNAASNLAVFSANGGVTFTTAGAAADQIILQPHQNAEQASIAALAFGTEDSLSFETTIKTGANIASAVIWAGMKKTDTPVIVTDTDQVFFRYENGENSGKFELVHSRTGVDIATNTDVTVAVSTVYKLKIIVFSDLSFEASIDGAVVVARTVGVALTTGVDLIPFIGIQSSEAVAKSIESRFLKVGLVTK